MLKFNKACGHSDNQAFCTAIPQTYYEIMYEYWAQTVSVFFESPFQFSNIAWWVQKGCKLSL